jgi:hypothetical protein
MRLLTADCFYFLQGLAKQASCIFPKKEKGKDEWCILYSWIDVAGTMSFSVTPSISEKFRCIIKSDKMSKSINQ